MQTLIKESKKREGCCERSAGVVKGKKTAAHFGEQPLEWRWRVSLLRRIFKLEMSSVSN